MIQSREDIKKGLEEIFQETFEDESIALTDDTTAEDIEEWDSLTHVNLIMAIEKEFKISFTLEELDQQNDVGDTIDSILKKI